MRATLSLDGLHRFTVSIRHRIGLDALIDGLGWTVVHAKGDELYAAENKAMAVEAALKAYSSRAAIMKAAIESIAHDGDSVWVWADDCSAADTIREQARVLVLRKFPELKSTKGSTPPRVGPPGQAV